jgi:hypothetical protein
LGLTAVLVAVAAVCEIPAASPRPIGLAKRSALGMRAQADHATHLDRRNDPPGFQIELVRGIAKQLGVGLDVVFVILSAWAIVQPVPLLATPAERQEKRGGGVSAAREG